MKPTIGSEVLLIQMPVRFGRSANLPIMITARFGIRAKADASMYTCDERIPADAVRDCQPLL